MSALLNIKQTESMFAYELCGFSYFLKIAYEIAPRRGGDIASCYADPRLAEQELGWTADFGLERMCT